MSERNPVFEGGCHCGAARYRAAGQAGETSICHCESCRRASGAPVTAWATFRTDEFAWTGNPPATYESSPGVARTHCAICGTSLTFATESRPGEIDVMIATLDDPEAVPVHRHVFADERLSWMVFAEQEA